MSAASPSCGPALLVPMTLEAVVITGSTETGTWRYDGAWAWNLPNYGGLESFHAIDPQPLSESPPSPAGHKEFAGVVLHWALPDALTHGTEASGERDSDTRAMVYPPIPNRWLVVRKTPRPDGLPSAARAWVVVSDALGADDGAPYTLHAEDGSHAGPAQTKLGAKYELELWPPESVGETLEQPLTVLGPGNPSFAANVPLVHNVLSFADPLDGVDPGSITYSVYGWYDDQELDPLAPHRYVPSPSDEPGRGGWYGLMDEYRWTVDEADARKAGGLWAADGQTAGTGGEAVSAALPTRTVYHGLLFDVKWLGREGQHASGVPSVGRPGDVVPRVSIANSAIDALVAMLAPGDDDGSRHRTRILEAFQHDALPLLDAIDGPARVYQRVQGGWFADSDGGSRWTIEDPGSGTATDLSESQGARLTKLNVAQRQLDESARRLASLQWQRHAYWTMRQYAWKSPADELKTLEADTDEAGATLKLELEAEARRCASAHAVCTACVEELRGSEVRAGAEGGGGATDPEAADRLPAGAVLTHLACMPFRRPKDPLVLVNGLRRSFKHGADGRFTNTGGLFCRFSGQTVSRLAVPAKGASPGEVVVGAGDKPPLVDLAGRRGLPPELAALELEAFLLDPCNAPWIAKRIAPGASSDELAASSLEIAKLQTQVWNAAASSVLDSQVLAATGGWRFAFGLGAWPSKVGVDAWVPPWTPLFLEWQLEVFPATDVPEQTLDEDGPWALAPHGERDPAHDLSYVWRGGERPTRSSFFVAGRSLLAAQASDLLAARLEQAIDRAPRGPEREPQLRSLQEALRYAAKADLLGQSLGGFHAAIIDREPAPFVTGRIVGQVPDPEFEFWSPSFWLPPFAPSERPRLQSDPARFRAVRAGHCRIDGLRAVDAFGQVLDILRALSRARLEPSVGTDLAVPDDPGLVVLTPRITQPSRISLDLLDATDDDREAGIHHGANPVCGWIVPNRLDTSLVVYDADGAYAGDLRAGVLEQPPDAESAHAIVNAHLRAVVTAVADADGGVESVLALADAAASATAAARAPEDDDLQILTGHPLAVVRGRLRLELDGQLAISQAWSDVLNPTSKGFEKVTFPVQIGSTELAGDGVAGYWIDDDYATIQSVLRTASMPPYVGSRRPRVGFAPDGLPENDGRQPDRCLLTLLIDPSLDVHVVSGVLPVLTVTVPRELALPDLTRMRATFRVGPILDMAGGAGVTLPLPTLREGSWSWLQVDSPGTTAVAMPAIAADALPTQPDGLPQLRSGWLALGLAPPTQLTYAVAPAVVPCGGGSGARAMLEVTAYNARGYDVICKSLRLEIGVGSGSSALTLDPTSVSCSGGGPGPRGQWSVVADRAGAFTASPSRGSSRIGAGTTLTFSLTGIEVNELPGSARITVTEVAAQARGRAPAEHTCDLGVAKIALT